MTEELGYCAYCKGWTDLLRKTPKECTDNHGHDFVYDQASVLRQIRTLALLALQEAWA